MNFQTFHRYNINTVRARSKEDLLRKGLSSVMGSVLDLNLRSKFLNGQITQIIVNFENEAKLKR